jgi:hypothetical protein
MDLESHATPPRATPEQRYAALHRAMERGLVSDAIWQELAEVSLMLSHIEEASRCAGQITNGTMRRALESRLERLRGAQSDSRPSRGVGGQQRRASR